VNDLPDIPRVCVDASLAVATLVPELVTPQASAMWQSWVDERRLLVAPPHFAAEVLTALRRAGLRDEAIAAAEYRLLDRFISRILAGVSLEPYRPEICRRARG
jgi:predicted nucleic acid-binding protein